MSHRPPLRSSIRWARLPAGLWHYTSPDFVPLIERDGFLRPGRELLVDERVATFGLDEQMIIRKLGSTVWLTDDGSITRDTIGRLGAGRTVRGDRMTHRFRIDPATPVGLIMSFTEYVEAGALPSFIAAALVEHPEARPSTWFVAPHRIPIVGKAVAI